MADITPSGIRWDLRPSPEELLVIVDEMADLGILRQMVHTALAELHDAHVENERIRQRLRELQRELRAYRIKRKAAA